jgi:hypothetical protein
LKFVVISSGLKAKRHHFHLYKLSFLQNSLTIMKTLAEGSNKNGA